MTRLWEGVNRLLDEATDIPGLRSHGMAPLAVRRWRERNRPLPPELVADELAAACHTLSVDPLLSVIRRVVDGPIILLKGPELAARYPEQGLRPFGDLDLLVADDETAYRRLLDAGFVEMPRSVFSGPIYHRRPLRYSDLPLLVEIHSSPGWLPWMDPPSNDALFRTMVPSSVPVDGLMTLPPKEHALFVAMHAWRDEPLSSLGNLLDVALLAEECDANELDRLAWQWGLQGVWNTTTEVIGSLFYQMPGHCWPLKTWARSLAPMHERTVLGAYVVSFSSGMWAPNAEQKRRALITAIGAAVRPQPGQSWPARLARVAQGIRHSRRPNSEYHALSVAPVRHESKEEDLVDRR